MSLIPEHRSKRARKVDTSLYETFHGKEPTEVVEIDWVDPEHLVYLGEAEAVEYRCSKLNGAPAARTGRMTSYRHSMRGKGNKVFTNEDGTMLVILGPTLRVEDRGIVD